MSCQRQRAADYNLVIFGDMCVKNDTSQPGSVRANASARTGLQDLNQMLAFG